VLEFIAPVNLRDILQVTDGDNVSIKIDIDVKGSLNE